MSDSRLTGIEEKLAYQEHVIQQLSDELYKQQQIIEKLEATYQLLIEKVNSSAANDVTSNDDTKPPHY